MTYNQLTLDERYTIFRLRMTGHSVSRIGEILDRDRSTIYRELQRNSVLQLERWTTAQARHRRSVMAGCGGRASGDSTTTRNICGWSSC